MKRVIERLSARALSFLLILALLCTLGVPLSVRAEQNTDSGNRYGYSLLKNDAQRYVYGQLLEGVMALSEKITLASVMGATVEDVNLADELFRNDYPECFWYRGASSLLLYEDVVCELAPTYVLGETPVTADSPELTEARAALSAAVNEFFSVLPADCADDASRALWIHDRLAAQVEYRFNEHDQSAYGALVEGAAVCAGYARAYQLLLLQAGIPALTVYGTSINPATGSPENHAWNLSFPEGACHYTDLTWNDQGDELYHVYFHRSLDFFAIDHTPTEQYRELLPECTHTPLDWYVTSAGAGTGVGLLDDAVTGAAIAPAFPPLTVEGTEGSTTAALLYQGDDFSAWLTDNRVLLADALGLTGAVHFSYYSLENEYHLTVRGTARSIPLTEIALEETSLTLTDPAGVLLEVCLTPHNTTEKQLLWSSEDEEIVQVSAGGRLLPISNGSTTVRVSSADGRLSASCTVTVALPMNTLSSLTVSHLSLPVVGGQPQSAATLSSGVTLTSFVWECSASGREEDYLALEDETFVKGCFYRARLTLETLPGFLLSEDCGASFDRAPVTLLRISEKRATLLLDFGTPPESDVYRVDFVVGEGAEGPPSLPEVATPGECLIHPPLPYAQGKLFLGWYTDPTLENRWDFASMPVLGNLVLFAGWREVTPTDHIHEISPEAVEARPPSCTSPGYHAYYRCRLCGAMFLDAEGKFRVAVSENLLAGPATGHYFSIYEPHSGGHYLSCSCGERAEEGALLPHIDEDGDWICDLCQGSLHPSSPGQTPPATQDSDNRESLSELLSGVDRRYVVYGAIGAGVLLLLLLIGSLLKKKK